MEKTPAGLYMRLLVMRVIFWLKRKSPHTKEVGLVPDFKKEIGLAWLICNSGVTRQLCLGLTKGSGGGCDYVMQHAMQAKLDQRVMDYR